MNSKQRRQSKRKQLRYARKFSSLIEQLLDDLESGKETIASCREGLEFLRESLEEA